MSDDEYYTRLRVRELLDDTPISRYLRYWNYETPSGYRYSEQSNAPAYAPVAQAQRVIDPMTGLVKLRRRLEHVPLGHWFEVPSWTNPSYPAPYQRREFASARMFWCRSVSGDSWPVSGDLEVLELEPALSKRRRKLRILSHLLETLKEGDPNNTSATAILEQLEAIDGEPEPG